MPVRIPNSLPAAAQLAQENIFVMREDKAVSQDIRPLRIAILNLMPTKEVTETQLLRLIGNSPLQVDITLLQTATYEATHTSQEHLNSFYRTFDQIKDEKYDGLVITGAPVEQMDFEEVRYWEELQQIMRWAQHHVFSTIYICWAAQAGLYYHYQIPKYPLQKKMFGVFPHNVLDRSNPIVRGFDDVFIAPHSRHTEIRREDILKNPGLVLLAESPEAGVYLVASTDRRHIFVTGHGEYDANSLHGEYVRDIGRGMDMDLPRHYYPGDDPEQLPPVTWRSHGTLLFANWLNYCVYQETPYDLNKIL